MEDKNLRITTEEQVEANRVTIAAEIIRTDKNVTDIIEIKDRLNFEDLPVTEGLTGKLEDLNTTTKENLVAAINENVGRLNTNDSLDAVQNIRLENIENSLSTVGSDYSTLTASGQLTQTVQIIKPTIIRNFTNDDLAVNTINPTTLELSTLVKKASTVRGEFYFTAQQLTGNVVDFELQLYNVSTSTVLDTVKAKMDFTGSIEFFSGTRTVKGDVGAGDTIVIRTFLSAGAVVTISQAGMDLSVTAKQGTISTINDTQIISTNTTLGNGNVAEDIEALRILDHDKATKGDLEALSQRVQTIEDADLVTGFQDLTTRVEDNEESIETLRGRITTAESNIGTNSTNITNLQNGKQDKEIYETLFSDTENTLDTIETGVNLRTYKELIIFVGSIGDTISSTTQTVIRTHPETIRYNVSLDFRAGGTNTVSINISSPTQIIWDTSQNPTQKILKVIGIK